MDCSYGVKSLRYLGQEMGCRIELKVDGECYCALDFRRPTEGLKIDGVLNLRKTDNIGYYLTEDELTGLVDVMDSDINTPAFEFIKSHIRQGLQPKIGDFLFLCVSNYLVRLDGVGSSRVHLSSNSLTWSYATQSQEYEMKLYEGDTINLHEGDTIKVVVKKKGTPQSHHISFNYENPMSKTTFLKYCSMIVGVLREEILMYI